jgi:phosphoribosyl-ATP pyrophosphohydrolase
MILDDLYKVILERKDFPRKDSYVSSLREKGRDEMLKKIGEESIEVIIASKTGDREHLIGELADLWFHCLILMAEEGISHDDIFRELEKRAGRKR